MRPRFIINAAPRSKSRRVAGIGKTAINNRNTIYLRNAHALPAVVMAVHIVNQYVFISSVTNIYSVCRKVVDIDIGNSNIRRPCNYKDAKAPPLNNTLVHYCLIKITV